MEGRKSALDEWELRKLRKWERRKKGRLRRRHENCVNQRKGGGSKYLLTLSSAKLTQPNVRLTLSSVELQRRK